MPHYEDHTGLPSRWEWVLVIVVVFAVLFVLFWSITPVRGAPVPREPVPELCAGDLIGSWRYSWGDNLDGRINLLADGTYTSHHWPDGPRYCGTWLVEPGGVLVLCEWQLCVDTGGVRTGPTEYRVVMCPRTRCGRSASGAPVRLHLVQGGVSPLS